MDKLVKLYEKLKKRPPVFYYAVAIALMPIGWLLGEFSENLGMLILIFGLFLIWIGSTIWLVEGP